MMCVDAHNFAVVACLAGWLTAKWLLAMGTCVRPGRRPRSCSPPADPPAHAELTAEAHGTMGGTTVPISRARHRGGRLHGLIL